MIVVRPPINEALLALLDDDALEFDLEASEPTQRHPELIKAWAAVMSLYPETLQKEPGTPC